MKLPIIQYILNKNYNEIQVHPILFRMLIKYTYFHLLYSKMLYATCQLPFRYDIKPQNYITDMEWQSFSKQINFT
jgi:hypothetical protein